MFVLENGCRICPELGRMLDLWISLIWIMDMRSLIESINLIKAAIPVDRIGLADFRVVSGPWWNIDDFVFSKIT
jgi:hypothetical protein